MNRLLTPSVLSLAIALGAAFVPSPSLSAQSVPLGRRHLYTETADPRADIAAALTQAKREHKHVLLDFGGDWCGDCQVLDIYFHQPVNADLLNKSFIVVHVFTTEELDKNVDVAAKYGVPLKKGVPALAVLDERGNVLSSQKTGEFSEMRYMDSSSLTAFLNRWKT